MREGQQNPLSFSPGKIRKYQLICVCGITRSVPHELDKLYFPDFVPWANRNATYLIDRTI